MVIQHVFLKATTSILLYIFWHFIQTCWAWTPDQATSIFTCVEYLSCFQITERSIVAHIVSLGLVTPCNCICCVLVTFQLFIGISLWCICLPTTGSVCLCEDLGWSWRIIQIRLCPEPNIELNQTSILILWLLLWKKVTFVKISAWNEINIIKQTFQVLQLHTIIKIHVQIWFQLLSLHQ